MDAPAVSSASYDCQQKLVEDRTGSQHALLDEHMRSKSTSSKSLLPQSISGGSVHSTGDPTGDVISLSLPAAENNADGAAVGA